MFNRRNGVVLLALVFGLTLSACSSDDAAPEAGGVWGQDVDGQPHLELGDDGSLAGNDGCNLLSGRWEQDGNTVQFNEVASTLRACPDVEVWMTGLASATVTEDTMSVLNEAGDTLGTLERQPS